MPLNASPLRSCVLSPWGSHLFTGSWHTQCTDTLCPVSQGCLSSNADLSFSITDRSPVRCRCRSSMIGHGPKGPASWSNERTSPSFIWILRLHDLILSCPYFFLLFLARLFPADPFSCSALAYLALSILLLPDPYLTCPRCSVCCCIPSPTGQWSCDAPRFFAFCAAFTFCPASYPQAGQ